MYMYSTLGGALPPPDHRGQHAEGDDRGTGGRGVLLFSWCSVV